MSKKKETSNADLPNAIREREKTLAYVLEPLDIEALRSVVRRLTDANGEIPSLDALTKPTLLMLANDLMVARFIEGEV